VSIQRLVYSYVMRLCRLAVSMIGMEAMSAGHNTSCCTGLFEMMVGVLTTCHTQYTSDSSICIFCLM
jgi:hypothetical protein